MVWFWNFFTTCLDFACLRNGEWFPTCSSKFWQCHLIFRPKHIKALDQFLIFSINYIYFKYVGNTWGWVFLWTIRISRNSQNWERANWVQWVRGIRVKVKSTTSYNLCINKNCKVVRNAGLAHSGNTWNLTTFFERINESIKWFQNSSSAVKKKPGTSQIISNLYSDTQMGSHLVTR